VPLLGYQLDEDQSVHMAFYRFRSSHESAAAQGVSRLEFSELRLFHARVLSHLCHDGWVPGAAGTGPAWCRIQEKPAKKNGGGAQYKNQEFRARPFFYKRATISSSMTKLPGAVQATWRGSNPSEPTDHKASALLA